MSNKVPRLPVLILALFLLAGLSACGRQEAPAEDFTLPEIHRSASEEAAASPTEPQEPATEPAPEEPPTEEPRESRYVPYCSLSDRRAVYWIYTDEAGVLPPTMTLYAWEDMSVTELVRGDLPQYAEEIDVKELRYAEPRPDASPDGLPDELREAALTALGDQAFRGCSRLTELWLPDSVRSIGDAAFRGCGALKSLRLPSGLEAVGKEAFLGCSALPSLTLEGAEDFTLGEGCFRACKDLRSVALKAPLEVLPARCFEDCPALEAVELPQGLAYLSYRCFYGCKALTELPLPDGLRYIGQYAFTGSGLRELRLPQGLLELGAYCFADTPLLALPALPDSLTLIGAKPFEGTPAIAAAEDQDGYVILEAGYRVLTEYRGRETRLSLPQGVQVVGGDCFRESRVETVFLPDSVVEIGDSAFRDCGSLREVTGCAGLERIGSHAFLSCSRLSAFAPLPRLKQVAYDGFWRCGSLEELRVGRALEEIDAYAFELCDELTVHCVKDSTASRRLRELGVALLEYDSEEQLFGG